MKRNLRILTLLAAAMSLNAAFATPAKRPVNQNATFDAAANSVTLTATAPTHEEDVYDGYTYIVGDPLEYITKVTIERHTPGTEWPDTPIGTITDVQPGGEIKYVDTTVEPDNKYEYRLVCHVDEEKGSPAWQSVYTGITPGKHKDFKVTTPDHKTPQFDITFTAPEVDKNGNTLESIGSIRVEMNILYTWYTVAIVEDITPGETFSFPVTEGVELNTIYSLRAYAMSGKNGNGEATEASIYVGEDIPAAPEGLTWNTDDDKLTLTWELPETGSRGGSIDPDEVKYNVYVRYFGDKEYTQLAKNHPGELFTLDLDLVEEEAFQFAIAAANSIGESYKRAETPQFTAGPAAKYPFRESFAGNMFQHRGWSTATTQDDEYHTYKAISTHEYETEYFVRDDVDILIQPHDNDGGLVTALFYGYSETGQTESLITPRIDFTDAKNPAISFWYYFIPVTIEGTDNEICISAQAEDGEFKEVLNTKQLEKPEDHGWRHIIADLPLAGKEYGKVKIDIIHGSWPMDTSIDNILIDEKESAGINGTVSDTDNADAPVEYYNLQGIRVNNPTSGVYIRRQGSTTTKVLINE